MRSLTCDSTLWGRKLLDTSCVCPIYISRCPWFRNSLQCWIPHSISLHNEEFVMLSNTVRKKCFWFFELIYLALYKSYIVSSLTCDSTLWGRNLLDKTVVYVLFTFLDVLDSEIPCNVGFLILYLYIMRNLRCYLTLWGRNIFDFLSLYICRFMNLTLRGV